MALKDNFENLRKTILGTKTSNIDTKLNNAVKDIVSYKSQSGRNGYIDLVRNIISKTQSGMRFDGAGGMFSQPASPAALGQGSRLARYKTYEAIISNINYCYRALAVLTDNIMSPDDITKSALEIKAKNFLEDEISTESRTVHVKEIVKQINLEEHLRVIIWNTLKFGDFFVEIADAKTALTSKAYLAEWDNDIDNGHKELISNVSNKKYNFKVTIDYSAFEEGFSSSFKLDNKKKKVKEEEIKNVKQLSLVLHEPSNVIKLQSEMFPLCFGYLVFPKASVAPQLNLKDQLVNDLCMNILKSLQKKIPQIKEFSKDEELKSIIAAMIEQTDYVRTMNIRYIPPDRVVHFMRPGTKYYPYGESIFDSCQFSAKVLIALETALAVHRLARSTEKRKIGVEIGLPRDARVMIEKLKEEFRKRKISLDSFGTVDTIPSLITTFEDIYIPQKDGKPFVDISTFTEGNVDIRGKVDELKFLRDSVVSSTEVPASFLNIEENLSNKSALSEENILFARTIVNHQKYLSHNIRDIVEKIYNIINPEEALTILDNVSISLPPPKSLQYEREARYMSELANLVETLERIGIPKEYSKRKYLSHIDWEDLKNYELDEKIDKHLGTEKDEEMPGGIGGGMSF